MRKRTPVISKGDRAALEGLVRFAQESGATGAALISPNEIVVEDALAALCRDPGCRSYGLSRSCPPHVSGPSAFREDLKHYDRALVFKIDVPEEALFSHQRREIFRLLHELAAGIERHAVELGFARSRGYAGGSCKDIFCFDHAECLALLPEGECRNPHLARPSMSGFGVNVARLMETAGWHMSPAGRGPDQAGTSITSVCGLVLIG
jgi:predicted metal-binding protein